MESSFVSEAHKVNPEPQTSKKKHANRHIAQFLSLPEVETSSIQLVRDGRRLTAKRLLENKDLTLTKPILVEDTPQSIGMTVLEFPRRQVQVRDIADIIGHNSPVHVIDVEHQEELEGWTLADLVEYFEDEERLFSQHEQEASTVAVSSTQRSRRRRKAAQKCDHATAGKPRVLNQISLEFSKTPLKQKIWSPQFVRDLDWIDHAWPRQFDNPNDVYPNVQYYCLTSAAGCYTDFHLDFGGTAVWYHILNGEKVFCLIPPTKQNLAVYEEWLCRPDQAALFLPDMITNQDDVLRVSLKASQTLVIPTAWIHAVYTPTDSVVLGGNFLHGLDISTQLQVHCIESRTRVQENFRFPFLLPINFYAAGMYLDKLRRGEICKREVDGLGGLIDALDEWWKVQRGQSQLQTGPTVSRAAQGAAKKNECSTVEELLNQLRKEHERVVKQGIVPNPAFAHLQPPSKPKLKLKLTSKAPRAAVISSGGDKFRIVVSSSALKLSAAAPQTKPKRPREDTEWIDSGPTVDGDWMPAKSKKRTSASKTLSKPSLQKPPPAKPNARPAAKSTSRQRLMKRFR